ncbi:MAG: PadR family transcriptional regulator [Veillonellales bacterium]
MKLANVEFMLLQIICEHQDVSGYEISQLVKKRDYREWADIGTTSIYVGLNKLSKKQLVTSYADTKKQGKGPIPRKFKITDNGKKILKQEAILALSSAREREYRFDLALTVIPLLPTEEVITALRKRKTFLAEVTENSIKRFESYKKKELLFYDEKGLPFYMKTLFSHLTLMIKYEIDFIDILIENLLEKNDFTEN